VSGTRIVGGNTSAADALSITTTVLGTAYAPLRRSGLHDGDTIFVTGQLGGPGAAVTAWRKGETPAPAHRDRFARPTARLQEARWLAERGATAAIDVSDGLIADLQHLAAASGMGLDVELALLPRIHGVSDLEAASSGEEYELAVGAPSDLDVAEFATRFGIPLTRIGQATRAHDGVVLTRAGARVANPRGHDHLSS
jgi:thiamine-monophosphate kinase